MSNVNQETNLIFLSDVRLSFPHLIEPQKSISQKTGKERISYNCDFIMEQTHPGFAQFMQRYYQLAAETWKEHANTVIQMIQNDRKQRCYGIGSEKVNKKDFTPYDGYNGMVFISAGRDTPPQIIQADGTPIDPNNTMAYQQLTRKMYGGCRVNAAIKPWIQKNEHGNGVRCDLVAIQFCRDDKPFGEGATDASGMFGAVAGQPAPAGFGQAAPTFPGAGMPPAPFGQAAPTFSSHSASAGFGQVASAALNAAFFGAPSFLS